MKLEKRILTSIMEYRRSQMQEDQRSGWLIIHYSELRWVLDRCSSMRVLDINITSCVSFPFSLLLSDFRLTMTIVIGLLVLLSTYDSFDIDELYIHRFNQ